MLVCEYARGRYPRRPLGLWTTWPRRSATARPVLTNLFYSISQMAVNTVYRKTNPSRKTSHEFVYQHELPASGSLDRYGSAIHQSNHAWLTSTRLLMDNMLKVYARCCPSIPILVKKAHAAQPYPARVFARPIEPAAKSGLPCHTRP